MTTRPDPDPRIAAWLQAEAPDRAPERLLSASRDRIQTTHQRRAWWPARRVPTMNTVSQAGDRRCRGGGRRPRRINLLPRQGGTGGPRPSPTAVPSPTPSPIVNFSGSFAPGTTYAIDDPCCVGSSRITFTMPATGWSASDFVLLGKNVPGSSDGLRPRLQSVPGRERLHRWLPLAWHGAVPTLGPTVDDLATALSAQAGLVPPRRPL